MDRTRQDRTVEDGNIEDRTTEDGTIECRTLQNRTIEEGAVECQTMEDRTMQEGTLEAQNIRDRTMEIGTTEYRTTDDDSMENRTIDDWTVEECTIVDRTVLDRITDDGTIVDDSENRTSECRTMDNGTIECGRVEADTGVSMDESCEEGLESRAVNGSDLEGLESDDQVFDDSYDTYSDSYDKLDSPTDIKRGSVSSEEQSEKTRKLSERSRVTELIEDAMLSLCKDRWDFLDESSTFENDRYGFSKQQSWEEDDDHCLRSRARRILRRYREKEDSLKEFEMSVRVKWENYFVSISELQPCPELKMLIRLGIPYKFRERVWNACVHFRVGNTRKQLGENYYKNLLEKRFKQSNPAAKQIELDLLRTLPNNRHFENLDSLGIQKLRRVLTAYSYHNPLIGYCQGINRIAAISLLFLNEEDAFWCLLTIMEYIMPADYYSKTLLAAQADQRVLKDIMQEKLPKLCQHFKKHEVDLSLFTFNWFLTVYVDNIPPETFLRIWDCFLYEGTKVLFRFAIAFFKFAENDLLALNDHMGLHKYLRYLGELMLDYRALCRIAFRDLNPFPMRFIKNRRVSSTQQVQSELEAIDAIREDFKTVQIPKERMRWWVEPH